MISPKQFQRVFADWMNECHQVSSGEVIAIDGKTLDSHDQHLQCRQWCGSGPSQEFHDVSYEWAGLKKLGIVVAFRQEGDQVPDNAMVRYYISSKDLTAVELAEAARQHYTTDMASENLAGIRHIAMNYLKSETTFKGGIKRKQKKAAMMESYLAKVLAA